MKSRFLAYLIPACAIWGCEPKPAPPAPAPPPPTKTEQPAVQAAAFKPEAPEPPTYAPTPVKLAEAFDLVSLLNRIPTKEFTISQDGGWDKFTMPKVQKWVRENLCGKRERIDVCMLHCDVAHEDANSKPDEWTVTFQVAGTQENYAGMANRILPIGKEDYRVPYLAKEDQEAPPPTIGVKDKASFALKCTEAMARTWDEQSKAPEPSVTVEGDIVGISFQPRLDLALGDFLGYDIFAELENVTATPSKDTAQGVLYACKWFMSLDSSWQVPVEGITELKRLGSGGDYQLIFLKYNEWATGKRNVTKLLSFSLTQSLNDFNHRINFTPCGDPPTESQLAKAKSKVSWPTSAQ